MRRYTIVIEQAPENYSPFVPSLPGCIETGRTIEEILSNMREAIASHIEVMEELGTSIPEEAAGDDVATHDSALVETRVVEIGS